MDSGSLDKRRFEAARDLFDAVCDLAPAERDARLAAAEPAVRELVRELLVAEASSYLDVPVLERRARARDPLPRRVAGYELLELLGAGGMGVVYKARQSRPERLVALKLVRATAVSPDTLRRFEHEAEVLARLTHPGIARVYEAGTVVPESAGAEPEPYFAMELIEGRSLTRFAREEGLDANARLRLMEQVCGAVQHAHRKGVIHRDLKPGNILVTAEGQAKVLDFGVARLTAEHDATTLRTRTGEVLGTLAYMSPEQLEAGLDSGPRADDRARADVDTRADVYSLGVIAYELLSEVLPHDVRKLVLHEAARRIVEDEPTRLGQLVPALRGDVETLVGKAMAKDRERRYASAEELARDIHRYLSDEPIEARPPDLGYRAAKFARRHRKLVAAVSGVFLALVVSAFASTHMYLGKEDERLAASRALEQEREAEHLERAAREAAEESERSERAARELAEGETALRDELFQEFLGLMVAPTPWASGTDVKMVDVLELAAQRAETAFLGRPLLRSQYLEVFGSAFHRLGADARALEFYEAAYELAVDHDAPPERIARLDGRVGFELQRTGESGLPRMEAALAELGALDALGAPGALGAQGQGDGAYTELALQLAYDFTLRDRADEALQLAEQVLATLAAQPRPQPAQLVLARQVAGDALVILGRPEAAIPVLADALRDAEALEPDSLYRANALSSMAGACLRAGRPTEALEHMEEVLAMMRRAGATSHPHYAIQLADAGVVHNQLGHHERALALLEESLQLSRAAQGYPNVDSAIVTGHLGESLRRALRFEQAEAVLRDAVDELEQVFGRRSYRFADGLESLGKTLVQRRRYGEAAELLREVLATRAAVLPAGHSSIAAAYRWLGICDQQLGDFESAAADFARALPGLGNFYDRALCEYGEGSSRVLDGDVEAGREQVLRARETVVAEQGEAAWLALLGRALLGLCDVASGAERQAGWAQFEDARLALQAARGADDPEVQRLDGLAQHFAAGFGGRP